MIIYDHYAQFYSLFIHNIEQEVANHHLLLYCLLYCSHFTLLQSLYFIAVTLLHLDVTQLFHFDSHNNRLAGRLIFRRSFSSHFDLNLVYSFSGILLYSDLTGFTVQPQAVL